MRPVQIMLIVYCLAAALGLGGWAWYSIRETNLLSDEIATADAHANELGKIADAKTEALRELEDNQRQGRKQFTGPEAVDASFAVQEAQDELDQAEAQVKAAAEQVDALVKRQSYHSRMIVPLLAGVLLHLLFGISLVRTGGGLHAR